MLRAVSMPPAMPASGEIEHPSVYDDGTMVEYSPVSVQ
jgi:hypothetical protein